MRDGGSRARRLPLAGGLVLLLVACVAVLGLTQLDSEANSSSPDPPPSPELQAWIDQLESFETLELSLLTSIKTHPRASMPTSTPWDEAAVEG